MTNTVLIMLDDDYLDEDFEAMIAIAPPDGGDASAAYEPSPDTAKTITTPQSDGLRFAHRRRVLAALAESILEKKGSLPFSAMTAPLTKGEIEETAYGDDADLSLDEDERVSLLSGIGAIIIRGEDLDIDEINQRAGVSAIPDTFIPMVDSVEIQTDNERLSDHWHLEQIGLRSGQSGGKGTVIGILDTGIDRSHPEFSGKRVYFQEFDKDGRPVNRQARDASGHGTHVCSIAAGATYGVAPNAALAVAAVMTTRDSKGKLGGKAPQIAAGIDWLVKKQFRSNRRGVDIINVSIGLEGYDDSLISIIHAGRKHGIPTVAAIGNNGRKGQHNHTSPGNYAKTLGVGASDIDDMVADFSDWGKGPYPEGPRYPVPNISAPGVHVKAAIPGRAYARFSGTSQAAPIVTGVAARWMAANPAFRRNPEALFGHMKRSLDQVRENSIRRNQGGLGRIRAVPPPTAGNMNRGNA